MMTVVVIDALGDDVGCYRGFFGISASFGGYLGVSLGDVYFIKFCLCYKSVSSVSLFSDFTQPCNGNCVELSWVVLVVSQLNI